MCLVCYLNERRVHRLLLPVFPLCSCISLFRLQIALQAQSKLDTYSAAKELFAP